MTDLAYTANLPRFLKTTRSACAARYGLLGTTALCAASLAGGPAVAEPTGGTIVGGDGAISQVGAVTTVDQTTQKLSLTWTSLDVGQAESLVFNQPGADAIALNRVLNTLPTNILGSLTANGNVWIINPNGVVFGPNSVVNVSGLLATTTDIPEAQFWDENFSFSALTGSGVEYSKITADGTILAGKGGVVLVAPVIEASGMITTNGGDVVLATAKAFKVDFDGDGLLSFTVEAGGEGVLQLTDSSAISAVGGAVYLSAGAADAVTSSVVNVGGLIDSTRVEQHGGEIVLSGGLGGEVIVTAELSAPGAEGQTGGSIDVFGDTVTLASGASLDVSGPAGGGTIRVGGDYQGGGDAQTATTTWVTADAMLNADATVDGDGGEVIVWSDHSTVFEGSLSAVGAGSGDGGFAEISGKQLLSFAGTVNLSAPDGAWGTLLFDPETITIVAGAGADDGQVTGDGQIDAGDGGTASFVIGATTLDTIDADVVLQASGDINVNANLTLDQNPGDQDLTLDAGGDIVVSQSVTITTDGFIDFEASGSIILNASVTISNSDTNSNPDIDFNAGDQILFASDVSITADGDLTLFAGGSGDHNAAIVFGANSSLTSSNGLVDVSSTGGSGANNNTILFGGGFDMSADTTIDVSSSDQIIFGAVLNSSGTQVYSDGSISFDSASGATFSAGLDVIFMSDTATTTNATDVGVTGSVLFTVTGSSDSNDIIFQDYAAFTVSGGEASFDTTGDGDIEIQHDASIQGTSSGSLNFVSDDQVQVGASVTISTADDDITIQGGQAFVASDALTVDSGHDLVFDPGSTVTFNASGAITLMADNDIIIDNSITLTGAPSVLFDAGNDFSFDHSGTNTISSAPNLTIQSGADINIGDDEVISGSGSVALDAGDDVNILQDATLSASTTLLVEAADDITLGSTSGGAGDDITFNASGGTTIRVGDTLTLDANGGDHTDIHVTGSLTIDTAEISFDSSSTINAGTATVTFSSVSDGAITIDGGNTGLNVSATDLDKITAGEIAFVTGGTGSITVDTLSFNDADKLTLTAGGDVTFEGDSTIDADLAVNATDTVTVNAGDTLGVTGTVVITSSDLAFGDGTSGISVSGGSTPTLTLVNIDTDLMTLGDTGAAGEWDITSTEFAQLDASIVVFQTAGDVAFDGFTQASDTADLQLQATGGVTFVASTTSEFNENATIIAGDGDGTGSITIAGDVDQVTGSLILYGEDITQTTGAIDSSGTIAFYAVDASGTFTGDVTLANGLNVFTNPVDAQGETVEIHASGSLPIGLIEANNALFDADSYDIDPSTTTTYVDVGTGTATLFFGSETITVSNTEDPGGDQATDTSGVDTLDLYDVDEDDFGFVNVGAAVGVGTSGDITVDGASWTTQGISLISTGGSVSFLNNASSFGGAVSIQSSGSITQDVALSSSGNPSFESSNSITLENAGNAFTGEINAAASTSISIVNGSTDTTTLGDIATGGSFTLVASGNVDSAVDATYEIGGSTTVTIDGATDSTVTLVSTGTETRSFSDVVTISAINAGDIQDVTIDANGQLVVGALDISGALDLTGAVNATDTIGVTQTGAWEVGGATSLDADLGDIVVTNSSNTFTGGLSLSGNDASATVDTDVTLNEIDLTGALWLSSAGNIGQDSTGSLSIDGTATLSADATGTIVLANTDNDFNVVVVSQAGSVDLADTDDIALTLPGDTPLSLLAASATVTSTGNLTDGTTGTIDVADLTLNSSGSVTFDNTSNDIENIAGASVTGNLALTTISDLTQSGPMNVSGTTTIIASSAPNVGIPSSSTLDKDITLGDFGNVFGGAVSLTGDEVFIATTATLTLGAINANDFSFSAPSFLFDSTTFDGVSGTLTFVAQPGLNFLLGENHYLLTDGTDTFGIDAASTTFVSNDQINILEGETQLTGIGFETDQNIYVDGLLVGDVGVDLDVTLNASGTVQFIDALAGSVAASDFDGNLTVNAGGAISQFFDVNDPNTFVDLLPIGLPDGIDDGDHLTANVIVGGFATFNSSSTVTLTNAGNNFSTLYNAVSGSATNFSIVDVNSIALGEIMTTGNVSVTSGGTVYVNDSITSGGAVSLAAAGDIIDNDPDNLDNDPDKEFISATSSLTLNATGSVILDITGLQISGTTTVTSGSTVNLSDTDNDFGGAVTVTGTSLSLTDANGVSFGAVTLGGVAATNFFSVTANADGVSTGSVTITGALDSGNATINAGGGNVTATNAGNDIDGTVTVTANNLSLTNTGGVGFGTTNLTGNLVATSTAGSITDSGVMNVSGTSSFTATAAGQGVNLNSANDFDGAVSANTGYVVLVDVDDLTLGAITQTNDLYYTYVSAGGPVTGSQKIDAAGYLYIYSGGASGAISLTGEVDVGEVGVERDATFIATNDITVNNALNDFDGEVVVSGANVTLRDANSISFGPSSYLTNSSVSGNLLVTSGGAVADNAGTILNVSGTTTVNATSSVTLDNANDFGGAVAVDAGGAVSLKDVDDILLGDIDAVGQSLTVVANASGGITDGATAAISQASDTAVTVAGASFTAGAGADIDLSESGNNFTGAVTIVSANDATITDANALTLGSVTLSDAGADTGDLIIDAGSVSGTAAINVPGDMTVTVDNGSFLSSSEINVTGATDINAAGETVTLNSALNNFGGDVTVDGANVTLSAANDADGTAITFGESVVTTSLVVNTTGDVDQSGAITGGSSMTVNVNALLVDIRLLHNTAPDDDFENNFSYFAVGGLFPANSLALRDASGDISFGNLDVATDFSLEVVGDIDSNQVIDVDGNTYIQVTGATSTVSLTNTGNTFGVNSSHSLTVIANGDVTVNGSSATGDVNIDGDEVTLDIDAIGGAVNVTGSDTTIISDGAVRLGQLEIDGNLGVDANNGGLLGATDTAILQDLILDGSGSVTTSIDVSGTTTLDANGADIVLLNGDLTLDLLAFATPDQPNDFGGAVTINNANDIYLGSSSDLTVAGADSVGAGGVVVFLAPDMDITGSVSGQAVYLISSSGETTLGDGLTDAGLTLSEAELAQIDASDFLQVGGHGDVSVGDLSLSGADLGYANVDPLKDLGLVIFSDGNVAISGYLTSSSGPASALDLKVEADNIYVTGKLGVEGAATLMPLGDVTLQANNDVLIGTDIFVGFADATSLSLFEFIGSTGGDTGEVLVHNVDDVLNPANFTIIGSGNIAMQTTVLDPVNVPGVGDTFLGLQVGTLSLQGGPAFINLFGTIVFGGSTVGGVEAAAVAGNTPPKLPYSSDYEFNSCIIGSPLCSGVNTVPKGRPPDEDLYLDLSISPEEEDDDDPFTNRGNEEEWR